MQNLEFAEPWKHLTDKERNYAYYMAKASWAGARMVLHQLAYEAPPLFVIFQAYFAGTDFENLFASAEKSGVTADEWKNFLAYVGGFYGNLSNYHSFGDLKFVPQLEADKFKDILYSHPALEGDSEEGKTLRGVLDELFP